MLTGPTFDKLITLNLGGMARALAEQRESPAYTELPFEDRLGLLVDREATERENRRLERYLRAAKLRVAASVEDIDFRAPRGLDRSVVLDLAAARWVAAHQQVLLTGPTGVGKTYLACALAAAAIRAGHTALYARVPRLLAEIGTARVDGRLARLLAGWARIEVLVLDDFALQPLTDAQAADLLEVIEDRAGVRSTIVTSQLPVALWHEGLGEPTVADAICDRLLAGAHRIDLTGASLRRAEARP
ncbi:MAG: IS21-like element helper ATPase IstB [Phycisphaerales bacterium]|nr:IS21-like element helper ATPase IstB [Phycisphaerales bacterium]